MMPIVSVILPVYNGEEFLQEAINSILSQTHDKFELLVIDDCSTDNSFKVAKSFNEQRIKVLQNDKNMGLIYTLNRGLSEAKGKYVARMDQDDVSIKVRLEKQVEFLEKNPDISIVGSSFKVFGKKSYQINHPQSDADIKANLLFTNSFCHPSVVFRKKSLDELNLKYDINFKHTEDYAFWAQNADKLKYANINQFLLNWRYHNHDEAYEKNSAQAINCKIIRTNYLKRIGINPNEDEINLHEQISSNKMENLIENQIKMINWFSKIYIASKFCNFLDEQAILNKLFEIMNRYLSGIKLNKSVAKALILSPLGQKLKLKKQLKLIFTRRYKI